MTGLIILLVAMSLSAGAWSTAPRWQVVSSAHRWVGPDGEILPFQSDDEVLEFLREARIVSAEAIHEGINRPRKLLLEREAVRAHAILRTVDERFESGERLHWRRRPTYRDNFAFECAAFELSRLLGIDRVPPAVERRYRGRPGSVQIWVENTLDEETRRTRGLAPPSDVDWSRQNQTRIFFDALIQNEDRNLGNLLIDTDWNVWLIDHTRSFVPDSRVRDPQKIWSVSRSVWQNLRTLDRRQVENTLSPYLTARELEALFVRWDKLVAHLEALIDRLGEPAVVWDDPPR